MFYGEHIKLYSVYMKINLQIIYIPGLEMFLHNILIMP
jgi:hypothetical protein